MAKTRCYRELRALTTFEDRFEYLAMPVPVGMPTFGYDRWMNQLFYASREWHEARAAVIVRDLGCDLGIPGYEIPFGLLVHHMNPMTIQDIKNGSKWVVDPEYLITTSKRTHNAIHFGDRSMLMLPKPIRKPGDTRLW